MKTLYKQINPPAFHRGIFYAFLLLFTCQGLFSQARVEVIEPKKNFGHVKRGKMVVLNYDVYNAGDSPLIILEAEVSCSCTNVLFSKEPIAPGKSTRVQVSFDTKSVYGRQDRVVYLKSNDPKGEARLYYKGHVSKK
ncbi:MAG TPA: DUF1573 domain-containing protein [Bacteroidia bacterium]|nr:DUF1573 domain-containing protein [Bacteroidia bacterium]